MQKNRIQKANNESRKFLKVLWFKYIFFSEKDHDNLKGKSEPSNCKEYITLFSFDNMSPL